MATKDTKDASKDVQEPARDALTSVAGVDSTEKGPVIQTVRVLIQRDETTKIPVDVAEYEIPILEVVHGPDKLEVTGEESSRNLDSDDADAEYQRLMRKYDTRNGINPVLQVYGSDPSRLASAMGLEFARNRGARGKTQLKQSLNVDHSKK